MTPTLIIVGADKGGVGKTTISRVLLDYCKDKGIKPEVFDTEGALHKFYPYARIVDIDRVDGQMQIFDTAYKAEYTIVDMKAGVLSETLKTMRNAGLLTPADRGNMRLIVLHVLGSSVQSLSEIVDTNAMLAEGGEHILIENRASDGSFFKWDEGTRKSFFEMVRPAGHIEIPHLAARATEDVDRSAESFANYIRNDQKKHSDFLTRLVKFWRGEVYKAFDGLNIVRG